MSKRFSIAAVVVPVGSLALAFFLVLRNAGDTLATTEGKTHVVVYKNPQCGCCGKWVKHMQDGGFAVEVRDMPDVDAIRTKLGVPAALGSCHTATVNGYVIEGHVPASDIQRLLSDKTPVAGLAVPGMPEGSPGMEGSHPQAYNVLAFSTSGRTEIFATHSGESGR